MNAIRGKDVVVGAVGGTALATALFAGLTVWLIVMQPATIATAVTRHDVTPFVQAVLGVLRGLLLGLIRYL